MKKIVLNWSSGKDCAMALHLSNYNDKRKSFQEKGKTYLKVWECAF